ncbi:MAG: ADP-heptose--LPS heptosyltransferase RfaF, partial [Psychroserpens sp.]|nr:ADP-heptose--LPS heptosyltransferase RfaF [Psychroserpens sp.]
NLKLMVSMDSGNAHLAAMFGVKVITIWGVTHPYAGFYPFDQDTLLAVLADRKQFPKIPTSVYGNVLPEGYDNAIGSISVETIVKKIDFALNYP